MTEVDLAANEAMAVTEDHMEVIGALMIEIAAVVAMEAMTVHMAVAEVVAGVELVEVVVVVETIQKTVHRFQQSHRTQFLLVIYPRGLSRVT